MKVLERGALAICVAIGLYLAGPLIGRIEGNLFPVVTEAKLTNPTPAPPPDYRHRWRAEAVKLRNCEYLGPGALQWRLGQRHGASVPVVAIYEDAPQIRGPGVLRWSGLLISLDPSEVHANSYADVLHQCPWRWWPTRSRFFTGVSSQ